MEFFISSRNPLLLYERIFHCHAGFCADRRCSAPQVREAGLRFSFLTQHSPQTVDRGFKSCKINGQKGIRDQPGRTSKPDNEVVGGVGCTPTRSEKRARHWPVRTSKLDTDQVGGVSWKPTRSEKRARHWPVRTSKADTDQIGRESWISFRV